MIGRAATDYLIDKPRTCAVVLALVSQDLPLGTNRTL